MTRWFSTEPARVAVCAVGMTLGLVACLTLLTHPSRAENATPAPALPESASQIIEEHAATPVVRGFTSKEMMDEIEALLVAHRDFERDLSNRLAEMTPAQQQQIAAESAAAAARLMTDVLRVQARHARQAGNEEFARHIELQIAEREQAVADPASRTQFVVEKTRQPSHVTPPIRTAPPAGVDSQGLGQQGGQR